MIVNVKKNPYSADSLNDLETLSIATSMMTIYCGLYFITEMPVSYLKANPDSTNAIYLSEDMKMFFFSMIVLANALFFAYWCIKMYREVIAKIRTQFPKIYLCCCLCFN